MSNKLFKTLVYDKQVSLSVLETTELVNKGLSIHHISGGMAKTFACLLTAGAYMAGCLKSDNGAISITVKGEGDSCSASVSADKDLHIRGYIDGNDSGKLCGGTMTVIKDDGFFRPFVGVSELKTDDVAENLMQYFEISEQIPTAVAIGADIDENGTCTMAGGVIMQLLPGTTFENMDKAENIMQNFVNVTKALKENGGADGIVNTFFANEHDGVFVFETQPDYKCNCSYKKFSDILRTVPQDELYSICDEQGEVKVHCHYCNTDYVFNREDIADLFK